jgi:hypothetical protein
MTQTNAFFSRDDMFVLGNVAAMAVVSGLGQLSLTVLNFLRQERPKNAGSFLLYALFLQSRGQTKEAIAALEDSPVFEAEINRDEAIALHLVLLQADGQLERAMDLGHAYLGENIITSESAHHTVRTVIEEIEAAQARAAHSIH